MRKFLIIGKPNGGKTLFMLNFSQYLGYKDIIIQFSYADGKVSSGQYNIEYAKGLLCSNADYKTTILQSVTLDFPWFGRNKSLNMVDTSGLSEGIHKDIVIRRAMVQTLGAIIESPVLFHVIDVSDFKHSNGKIDVQLYKLGMLKDGYVILANKIDLFDGIGPIVDLQKQFPDVAVIPISAWTKKGFGELKSYVRHKL